MRRACMRCARPDWQHAASFLHSPAGLRVLTKRTAEHGHVIRAQTGFPLSARGRTPSPVTRLHGKQKGLGGPTNGRLRDVDRTPGTSVRTLALSTKARDAKRQLLWANKKQESDFS